MKKILFTLFLVGTFSSLIFAQSQRISNEIIMMLAKGESIENVLKQTPTDLDMRPIKCLSADLNVWNVYFREDVISLQELSTMLMRTAGINLVQYNYRHELRNDDCINQTPNDPQFSNQWQYINTGANGGVVDADIDADLAWDITTGGVTPLGDTIVICVVDDGIDENHPDFVGNLWVNKAEIPDNNLDDDHNGYIDDYKGWNAGDGNDNIDLGATHGTSVAGIVGAKGNNGVGVAGVNWDVKMMIVLNGSATSADAIASYSYPYTMRKRYNESGGSTGAFVVATNSSWGVNFGQPANEPLWCAFYDSLGRVGIVSCGAGPNASINVDTQGDLPTGCPSDYLIAVTNMNRSDVKLNQAGYGVNTIDLGSFGEQTWTVTYGGGYGAFGGTSGATPHVTGTLGLLYSAPCAGLSLLAKLYPDSAATLAKKYILDGVDNNLSLQNITLTEGRLNSNGALQQLLANCPPIPNCVQPFNINAVAIDGTSATILFDTYNSPNSFDYRYRTQGAATWILGSTTNDSLFLSGLSACTFYELEMKSHCATDTSVYSGRFTFKTDGCCESPNSAQAQIQNTLQAHISWQPVLAAASYILHYRKQGVSTWTDIPNIGNTFYTLSGLDSCTIYEYQVQTVCVAGVTPPGAVNTFRTDGCPDCIAAAYCQPANPDASSEWIGTVSYGTYTNNSGNNNGYAFFDNSNISFARGQTHTLTVTPAYSGNPYNENFRIYIDLNADGDFIDADEMVGAQSGVQIPTGINLNIPLTATIGSTRMRVMMRWQSQPVPCTDYTYGEFEDYCISIALETGIENESVVPCSAQVVPNPFNDDFTLELVNPHGEKTAAITLYDLVGRVVFSKNLGSVNAGTSPFRVQESQFLPTGIYFLEVLLGTEKKILKVVKN